MVSMNLIK